MRTKLALVSTTTLVLGLALASCSGPGAGEPTWEDSPLSKFFDTGAENKTDEEWQKEYDEREKRTEELVAQCMKDEGFEYIPASSSGVVISSGGEENEWKPDDREWVSKYGYGMLDYPGRAEMMAEVPPEGEEWVDPNQAYVEALSDSEREAYYATLYGDPDDQPEPNDDGSIEWDWTKSGCYGAAQHEVDGDSVMSVWEDEQFADLNEAINKFYEDIYSGEAFATLDKKWADCMAKADFSFKKQADAQESISTEINEFWESLHTGEGDEFDPDVYNFDKSPKMQEIQKREVEVALADLDCRQNTNYSAEQLKIQFAEEEKFIEAHRAELEALKAALEAQNKK